MLSVAHWNRVCQKRSQEVFLEYCLAFDLNHVVLCHLPGLLRFLGSLIMGYHAVENSKTCVFVHYGITVSWSTLKQLELVVSQISANLAFCGPE